MGSPSLWALVFVIQPALSETRAADDSVLAVPEPERSVSTPVPGDSSPIAAAPVVVPHSAPPRPRFARLRDRIELFPYGWVRTDATYYSAAREGYSNVSLSGARIGGGVTAGPVTVFVTIEAANAKGPQLFDAYVAWDILKGLRLRAGQFKAPFGYRFNAPDLVDELPRAPLSMQAATPGRQVGIELSYDIRRHVELFAAVLSGIGQNREANNTRIAFAGKLQVRPFASRPGWPQLVINASLFTYKKTNGFSPTLNSVFGFDFFHGVPATGAARRITAGGGLFWNYLSARAEYFYTSDGRERDTDGDPFTRGEALAPMIGAGGYAQLGAVVTGQTKDPATLLPRLASARVRDSAVELSARFDSFRVAARDLPGNGVVAVTGGVNWVLLRHLRIFAAASWQRLDSETPEIPGASSWGITGGIAGYFIVPPGSGGGAGRRTAPVIAITRAACRARPWRARRGSGPRRAGRGSGRLCRG